MVVCFVANDIKGIPDDEIPKKVLRQIKYFVKQVREQHPRTRLAFIEITPTSSRWKQWNDIEEVNRLVKEICERKEGLCFISTAEFFLGYDSKPNDSLFLSDRLHFNPEGYAVWNQLIKSEIIRVKNNNF